MSNAKTHRQTAYGQAVQRLRGTFLAVALFSAAVNVLMLTGPIFMLQVYDRVLASGSVPTLQALYLIVVVLFIFLGVYDFLRTRIMSRAAYRVDQHVSDEAYSIWLRNALSDLPKLSRPLSDLATVRGFMASPVILGFFDLPWIPLYLAVCFLVHAWLGWLTVGGLVIVLILALANQAVSRKHTARAMQMDGAEAFFVEQSRRTAEAVIPMGMRAGWPPAGHKCTATGSPPGRSAPTAAKASPLRPKPFVCCCNPRCWGWAAIWRCNRKSAPG